ncbi:MAG: hypothetical protein ACM3IJ_05540 [Candidatus Levyibacteriota bacterium]
MRVLLGIFLILLVPVAVFIFSVLYGGLTTLEMKQELSKEHIYNPLSQQIVGSFSATPPAAEEETTSSFIYSVIKNRFTPEYLQAKIEKAIDDSANWIAGKTPFAPEVSFAEVKQDIDARSPRILPAIKQVMEEAKQQQDPTGAATILSNPLETFIDNNFTVPLGKYLQIVKNLYQILTIALPILLIIMSLFVTGIILLTHSIKKKFLWLAIFLAFAGLYGFSFVLAGNALALLLSGLMRIQDQGIIGYITPILTSLTGIFVNHYLKLQIITSTSLLVASCISLILYLIIKFFFPEKPRKKYAI